MLSARSVMQNLGNGWVHIAVPVSQLNPRNLLLRNVQLKNATNRKLSTVHIDDVELVGP